MRLVATTPVRSFWLYICGRNDPRTWIVNSQNPRPVLRKNRVVFLLHLVKLKLYLQVLVGVFKSAYIICTAIGLPATRIETFYLTSASLTSRMASSELPLEPGELGPSSLTPALDTGIGMGATSLETVTYDAVTGDYNSLPTYPVRPSYRAWQSKLRLPTQCVVFDGCPQDPHKPSSTPIYQTAVSDTDHGYQSDLDMELRHRVATR